MSEFLFFLPSSRVFICSCCDARIVQTGGKLPWDCANPDCRADPELLIEQPTERLAYES